MFKRVVIVLFLTMSIASLVIAQDNNNLDENLFGGDDVFGDSIFTELEQGSDNNAVADLLTNETIVIGGKFGVAAQIGLALNTQENEDAFTSGLTDLSTRVFLDARPNSDFRAFIKANIEYDTTDGVSLDLREAFADIDINDTVFIRAGKQTINWGVGFFFSPANFINLEKIDPENPSAELSGPVAVKAQLPIANNNLTGYLIVNNIDSGNDLGIAARYELLLGAYELTVGGIYRIDNPWAVMATATGSIADVTVFGELVLEGNTNKIFIVKDSGTRLGYQAASSDDLYGSATVGARYSYTTEDELYSFLVSAQYFFNGLGYEDSSVFTDNPAVVGGLLKQGKLSFSDLRERGQHYAAVNLLLPDIANSNFTPSVLWLGSLSDGSGFVSTNLSYSGIDYLKPSFSYRYTYGVEGAEYSPKGDKHSLTLGFTISGSF